MTRSSERSAHAAVRLVPAAAEEPASFDSLPHPLTSFVGRERTSETLTSLLRKPDIRVVTLTGPGGMGKTRLAISTAGLLGTDFPDGVVFVPLAPLAEPDLVMPTIAQAIGVQLSGRGPLVQRLIDALRDKQLLLVLDNFEQVTVAAKSVAALLAACPAVKVLATSRVPLHITGEHELAVPPLQLPPSGMSDPGQLESVPSVDLFIQRARAVKSGFSLDASNAQTVASICRRLGGLPLAIELAAARGKVLSPQMLLDRLSQSLDILSGGPQDQPARLQAMRSTIGWSYDLLSPLHQAVFRRLSMFSGGAPLDGAEALCADAIRATAGTTHTAINVLQMLVDASLVVQETGLDGEPRLAMLEPIRQFGLEQLEADPGEPAARDWFTKWSIDFAERAFSAFTSEGPGVWGKRLVQEFDNMRTALTLLEREEHLQSSLRLATCLQPLWSALGNEREGYRWLISITGQCDRASGGLCTRAIVFAARLANTLGILDSARSLAEQGLALAAATGDELGTAGAHTVLGNIARGIGHESPAREHYEEALTRYQQLGDRYNLGYVLVQLGKLGDLGSVDRPGNPEDQAAAQTRCEEAIQLYQSLANSWGFARAKHQLAYVMYKKREYLEAARLSAEVLSMFWDAGDLTEAAACFEDLADVFGATGQPYAAARMYGVAEELRERLGAPMWPSYREEYEREVAITRAALPPARFDLEWQSGRALPLASAVSEALQVAELLGRSTQVDPRWGETGSLREKFRLTTRELEVLGLVAGGKSNQAIADLLFISIPTVKGHVQHIMAKLDLESRTAIAAWAHQHHLT